MRITDARARNDKPNDKDYKVADDRGLYPPKLGTGHITQLDPIA